MMTPRSTNTHVRYSEAFRTKILDDIQHGRNTITEVTSLYGIPKQTIYRWIHNYGDDRIIARTVRIELKGEVRMVKKLKQENKELKDAVAKLTLENLCLKAQLEVIEEQNSVSQKKNSFSMPSPAPEKKPGSIK